MKKAEKWEFRTLCVTKIIQLSGGEGKTHVTMAIVQKVAEGRTSYELSWRAKAIVNQTEMRGSLVSRLRLAMHEVSTHQ